jgi:hypothetical protein
LDAALSFFFALSLLLLAGSARADVVAWIDSLGTDPGVIAELERFERDEGDWPDDTPQRLADAFRQRVRDDVARAMRRIASGDTSEYVRVNFLSPRDFERGGKQTEDKRGREFEEGVIRTEQIAFFRGEDTPPTEALELFVDPEFRRQTTSRIESLEEEGDLSCLKTGGITGLLSPTWACNRVTYLKTDAVAAEHSQVVSNPGDDDYHPIYFKESVKVFVATDGGLALFYINYTRGAKLGSFKKKFGRGKIEDSQRERAAALAEWLDLERSDR